MCHLLTLSFLIKHFMNPSDIEDTTAELWLQMKADMETQKSNKTQY